MKFVHTNIITRDWKRLAQFYIDVFQCEIVPPVRDQSGEWLSKGTGVENAHLKGVHLRLPGYGEYGPTLEIYTYEEVIDGGLAIANRSGFGHIAFEVDDVDLILNNIKNSGGSDLGGVVERQLEHGRITFTYTRDPDGNIIELQHWTK